MEPPFGAELRAEQGPLGRYSEIASSPRSLVWRVELGAGVAVLKQVVGGDDTTRRYERELTALRLGGRVDPPVVPRLLGTDPAARVLVLEYLDHARPAEDWTVGYATALARLHAATGPADAGTLPGWEGPGEADAGRFTGLAGALGVPVDEPTLGELAGLVGRLGAAGGHALLHGDPCPGNDLHTPDGVRFVDLEQASLGSGLTELAYLRIGFPTCWCATAVPAPVLARAEAAYHQTWRAATGTAPSGDLVDACAGWVLRGDALVERLYRGSDDHFALLPDRDWRWGVATARQRLAHRLGVVAELTSDRPDLRGLSALCAAMRARMLHRWPGLNPLPARRP